MWRAGVIGMLALVAGCAQNPPAYRVKLARPAEISCGKHPEHPCRRLARAVKPRTPPTTQHAAASDAAQASPFAGNWVGEIRLTSPSQENPGP